MASFGAPLMSTLLLNVTASVTTDPMPKGAGALAAFIFTLAIFAKINSTQFKKYCFWVLLSFTNGQFSNENDGHNFPKYYSILIP
jgi:hypothetical protein